MRTQTDTSWRFRLGILLAHLAVISLLTLGIYFNSRPITFNAAAWRNEPWQRPRMIGDLTSTKLLDGRSVDEVKALLGSPDIETVSRLTYRLSEDGDLLYSAALVIALADGRVASVTRHDD